MRIEISSSGYSLHNSIMHLNKAIIIKLNDAKYWNLNATKYRKNNAI